MAIKQRIKTFTGSEILILKRPTRCNEKTENIQSLADQVEKLEELQTRLEHKKRL